MPRPALSCTVKLKIKQVTCPGTLHLMDRNFVFVTVSIIAQTRRTKSVFASFPFVFNEKIIFQRIFTNARTLDHVLEILEDEIVSIELRQYSERFEDGMILARFEQPTRQFLFPGPTFVPKDGMKREVLLTRTSNFSVERGIDPKIEFSTHTIIEEATIASIPRDHLLRTPSSPVRKSRSPRFSMTPLSSDTEEEIIINTPRRENKNRPVTSPTRPPSTANRLCECPNRPDSDRVTARARSASPGREQRKHSWYSKPPFKVGKAAGDLISRRDFGDEVGRAERSPISNADSCPNCLLPHPSLNDEPRKRNRLVKKQKARARIPVSSPESSSDDEAYRAALTVASERRRNRPRIFEQRGSGSLSPTTKGDIRSSRTGEDVHRAVRGLLQKNDSVLQYDLSHSEEDDPYNSHFKEPSFTESPALTSSVRSYPDRSVVVPLSNEKYWSQRARQYTGKSHRQIFNDSLGEIYKDIYNRTLDSD